MKTLTCDICKTHVEKAETDDQIMTQMWDHLKANHADTVAEWAKLPQEEQDKAMADAKAKIAEEEVAA